jgi:16S rRNA (cytosine1402-N4)-methyltransferase
MMVDQNNTDQLSVHISVLKNETVEFLNCSKGGKFIDCTLGGAGHTEAILQANPINTVEAFDRDIRAINRAKQKLNKYQDRVTYHHRTFSEVESTLEEKSYDGMLVDLGISTDQLKEKRGFSFNDDTPLDMRMDESQSVTASDIVNNYSEKDLIRVLKRGGADKEGFFAAKAIIKNRPITSTKHLADIVSAAVNVPHKRGHKSGKSTHPATTVFQAIRIEVNKEYEQIEALLESAPKVVKDGGRLAVITFHSAEDKLVAGRMRSWAAGDTTPAYVHGGVFDRGSKGRFLTTKPVVASQSELAANPASRSARLRVFAFGEG